MEGVRDNQGRGNVGELGGGVNVNEGNGNGGAFDGKAEGRQYDFFKLVLRWPQSYCSSSTLVRNRIGCQRPFIKNFTIHSLWPMYEPDDSVPSYEENNECTDIEPAKPDTIPVATDEIIADMEKYWPDITVLSFIKAYDLLKELEKAYIFPDNNYYSGYEIKDALRTFLGVDPQIYCNTDANGNTQLYEIGVCFHRNGENIDCPNDFSRCPDARKKKLSIKFPKPWW
ncbi:ribonuclease 1-like [Tripterygium wilfordii]|uniref:ribonuclease 1-like n=1 Tax=Tripterygium wilfordii TaxID=458696 RepID=UPI0018F7E4ED|nr:ribonuclease 1-like [Tripterygium wilfordii]